MVRDEAESAGASQGVGGRKRSRASWQDVRLRNCEPAGAEVVGDLQRTPFLGWLAAGVHFCPGERIFGVCYPSFHFDT